MNVGLKDIFDRLRMLGLHVCAKRYQAQLYLSCKSFINSTIVWSELKA
jgi:hypothetical protein